MGSCPATRLTENGRLRLINRTEVMPKRMRVLNTVVQSEPRALKADFGDSGGVKYWK